MLLKVSSTTVASRTMFYIDVEVVSLWMAIRNEKETAGLENMSLEYLVLIVEIFSNGLNPGVSVVRISFVIVRVRVVALVSSESL